MMKSNFKLLVAMLPIISVSGCSTSSQAVAVTQAVAQTSPSVSTSKMPGMDMSSPDAILQMAFLDELNGFDKIQTDISKGNYTDAMNTAKALHDEFHAIILPPLKDKKGNDYTETIHSEYDGLQDAIQGHNFKAILSKLKINRDNLQTVMQILGIKSVYGK